MPQEPAPEAAQDETPSAPQQPVSPVGMEDTIVIPPQPVGGQGAVSEPVESPSLSPQGSPSTEAFRPQIGQAPPTTPPVVKQSSGSLMKMLIGIFVLFLLGVGGVFAWQKLQGGSDSGGTGGTIPSVKQVTIDYWGLWENDEVTRQLIADFESAHPNIKVQYTKQSPKQYRERLQAAINRGEGPDVFRFHNTWTPMLRSQLATVPESVITPAEFSNTFFRVINNDLVAGSSIFGMPLMYDGLGLYINDDLFTAAGVSEPTTWADVINLIPKLTVKNGTAVVTSAIALGTTNNVEHFSDILAVMFLQNGANLLQPTGTEAEGTLIFYRKFSDPSDPLYTWNDGMDNSVAAFSAGRVAMILAPSWRAHEVLATNKQLRFHIAPIPQLQGNTVSWASYWVEGVSSRSKNQPQAWEFVKYLTSVEGATKLFTNATQARVFGEPYARVDLANSVTADPYVGAYVKQAAFARSFPLASRTFDNGLNDKLIQYLTDAVNSTLTGASPTQALDTMSKGFAQVFTTYGINTGVVETEAAP